MKPEVVTQFLTNTDDTGRFIVTSSRTGKSYFVEAIGGAPVNWGSIDPALGVNGKLMHKKGDGKYRGAIDEEDSLITEKNGFVKIHNLEPGLSPFAYIDHLDAKYPDKAVA